MASDRQESDDFGQSVPVKGDAVAHNLSVIAAWNSYGEGWPGTFGIPGFSSRDAPVLGDPIRLDLSNSYWRRDDHGPPGPGVRGSMDRHERQRTPSRRARSNFGLTVPAKGSPFREISRPTRIFVGSTSSFKRSSKIRVCPLDSASPGVWGSPKALESQ